MVSQGLVQYRRQRHRSLKVLALSGLILLAGCDPGGSPGSLSPPDGPSALAEQKAIQRLLDLYRQALNATFFTQAVTALEIAAGKVVISALMTAGAEHEP
jgi:hypothetical protein